MDLSSFSCNGFPLPHAIPCCSSHRIPSCSPHVISMFHATFAFPRHGADFCLCYYYFVVISFPFPSFSMIFLCSPPRIPTFVPLLPVFMCSLQRTSHGFTMLCPCPPQGFPWITACCFYALTTFYSDLPKGLAMVSMSGFTMISNSLK